MVLNSYPLRAFWVRAIAIVITGLMVVACQQSEPTIADPDANEAPAQTDEGLRLGVLLPTSGDLASFGQPMVDIVPLLVEQVNACGGVNDAPVTLIVEDSQTNPVHGAEAMTKLVETDRVHGVVGAFASSVSAVVVDIAVHERIPLISPGSTSPVFTQRAEAGDFEGYWARTVPPDTQQAQALAQLAIAQGIQQVSTLVINNDYGVGFEQVFIAAFEAEGGIVLNRENPTRYNPNDPDYTAIATEVFGDRPDAVVAVLYADSGSALLKSAHEQGLLDGIQLLLTDGTQTETFPDVVGQTADGTYILFGVLGTAPGAGGETLPNLRRLWQDNYDTELSAFVPHTWDAAALLILAAQAAGVNDGEAIMQEIRHVSRAPGLEVSDVCQALELLRSGEDINYQGVSSNVDVDELGDIIGLYDIWTVTEEGAIEAIDQIRAD